MSARQRATILGAIEQQLGHQPTVETRNRKALRPNPLAPWVLRVGNLRVYYDVEDVPERVVFVRAVGVKQRHRVMFGGEEFEL